MITYIRKNIKGYYIEFPKEIDANYWEGKIGTTYEDFLAGKWILLSAEQVAFHQAHPNAVISEVLAMEIIPAPIHYRTLEEAKQEKLEQIEEYDNSESVNSFDVHVTPDTQDEQGVYREGTILTTWITPDKRADYALSIESAKKLGMTEVTPVFNGIPVTISIEMADMALAQIQIYANRCFNVTETHKAAVNAFDSIEAIDAYDHTTGYPQRPEFYLYDAQIEETSEETE